MYIFVLVIGMMCLYKIFFGIFFDILNFYGFWYLSKLKNLSLVFFLLVLVIMLRFWSIVSGGELFLVRLLKSDWFKSFLVNVKENLKKWGIVLK